MSEIDILRQSLEARDAAITLLSENHRKEVDTLQARIKS